jgi:hypothetical protein
MDQHTLQLVKNLLICLLSWFSGLVVGFLASIRAFDSNFEESQLIAGTLRIWLGVLIGNVLVAGSFRLFRTANFRFSFRNIVGELIALCGGIAFWLGFVLNFYLVHNNRSVFPSLLVLAMSWLTPATLYIWFKIAKVQNNT